MASPEHGIWMWDASALLARPVKEFLAKQDFEVNVDGAIEWESNDRCDEAETAEADAIHRPQDGLTVEDWARQWECGAAQAMIGSTPSR